MWVNSHLHSIQESYFTQSLLSQTLLIQFHSHPKHYLLCYITHYPSLDLLQVTLYKHLCSLPLLLASFLLLPSLILTGLAIEIIAPPLHPMWSSLVVTQFHGHLIDRDLSLNPLLRLSVGLLLIQSLSFAGASPLLKNLVSYLLRLQQCIVIILGQLISVPIPSFTQRWHMFVFFHFIHDKVTQRWHMFVFFHFIHDKVATGAIWVSHISTHDQFTNLLTKPLTWQILEFIWSKICVLPRPTILRGHDKPMSYV